MVCIKNKQKSRYDFLIALINTIINGYKSGYILQFDNETVFQVKIGLRAWMGQRPVGYLAIYMVDDSADGNFQCLIYEIDLAQI